jgi:hypothetical protein
MLPMELPLPDRLVWSLPEALLHSHSVEGALSGAEAAAARTGVAYYGASIEQRAAKVAALEVQQELDALMVQVRGRGRGWGVWWGGGVEEA